MFRIIYFISIHIWNSFKTQALKIYLFFILLFILFPLLFSPLPELFLNFYSSIFWFSILITNFLSLEFLFKTEFEMAFFDFFKRQNVSVELYIILKVILYWLLNIFPLVCICFFSLVFYTVLSWGAICILISLVALQTLSLTFINAIGSLFLINQSQNYLLVFLILIPLVIPILLFGINLLATLNISLFSVFIICGNFLFILVIVPWLISYLIKININ